MIKRTYFILIFLLNLSVVAYSQNAQINIEQSEEIEKIFTINKEVNRKLYSSNYYTIQIFYGDLENAKLVQETFKELYPERSTKLIFETPNYKVRTGRFKELIVAEKELRQIKSNFPSAFLIKF